MSAIVRRKFLEKTDNKTKDVKMTLDELGVKRYCCRAMFLGQEDFVELVSKFKKA